MKESRCPPDLLTGERGVIPHVVPYEVDGQRERLVYLSREGDLAAYEELRSGFTAAVSHELRTPLARLLTLLETAALPGEDASALVEQARAEIDHITELIDEVLFLSELESGGRVVALGPTPIRPVLEEALAELADRAARAGCRASRSTAMTASSSRFGRGCSASWRAISPRTPSATQAPARRSSSTSRRRRRRSGPRRVATTASASRKRSFRRLFERFYRADRARASRGTGLGLAIVKHVVTQAGGTVEARGSRGRGLEVRCEFPAVS